LTKQRNSSEGRGEKKERRTRTGVYFVGEGMVSSKAWSRSWLMKEEDLRRM
jgi:hypothetical protein